MNRKSRTRHQGHTVNDQLASALQGVSHSKDSPGLQESCVRQQADEKRSALSAPHGCFNTYTQRESNEWRIYLTSLTGHLIYTWPMRSLYPAPMSGMPLHARWKHKKERKNGNGERIGSSGQQQRRELTAISIHWHVPRPHSRALVTNK